MLLGGIGPCAGAASAMVSQACRGGIRKLTNPRVTLCNMLALQQACLLINRHSECSFPCCDINYRSF